MFVRRFAIVLAGGLLAAAWAQQSTRPGALVRIYEMDRHVRALPDLAPGQLPNVARIVETIDLPEAAFAPLHDNLLTIVEAELTVDVAGRYSFELTSDDGAKLWIDQALLIDHDGLHAATPKTAAVTLEAGRHRLRIAHFQGRGGLALRLRWRPPGSDAFELIPPQRLTCDASASLETRPGKKRIIPPLRRGLPGDGSPVVARHPLMDGKFKVDLGPAIDNGFLTATRPPGVVWTDFAQGRAHGKSLVLKATPYGDLIAVPLSYEVRRVVLEEVGGRTQGCVFRFSGKGAAQSSSDKLPFEMRALRCLSNGLEIEFTRPLDERCGWDPECFYVEQWPFDAQAGRPPQRDGVRYPVKSASVSPDRRRVFLEIDGLKPGHVVYLRLLPPCYSEDLERPWSTEAWYTLLALPTDRPGQVRQPPPAPPQNVLTDEERAAGWRLLFDGRTTTGWRGYKKDHFPEGWEVKNGCLVLTKAGAGDICTVEQFGDFELKLEWRISAGGNSGIFYRVSETAGRPWESGPEMQVLDNAEHPDGRNPLTSAGSNYGLYAPVRDVTEPVGFFNRVRIVVRGNHVEHWLNGVKVVEYELGSEDWKRRVAASKFKAWPKYGTFRKGHILLQDHGDRVWYRNIKIRVLD